MEDLCREVPLRRIIDFGYGYGEKVIEWNSFSIAPDTLDYLYYMNTQYEGSFFDKMERV